MRRRNERERMERRLAGVMIPPRFQGRTFDSYIAQNDGQRKALKVCRKYADDFAENKRLGRCLLLLGMPGTGKTHLATAIAGHVVCNSASVTAAYRTVSTILQFVKGSFDREAEYTEAQAFEALCALATDHRRGGGNEADRLRACNPLQRDRWAIPEPNADHRDFEPQGRGTARSAWRALRRQVARKRRDSGPVRLAVEAIGGAS